MKQQHHPHSVQTYLKGANRDLSSELMESDEGAYLDACNFRTGDMDGNRSTARKIHGEELLYDNEFFLCQSQTTLSLVGNYKCIGYEVVKGYLVGFWADKDEVMDSVIVINDKLVLKSPNFDIKTSFPLQIAKNESCIGGEIYITDYLSPPMIFNIKDLLINSGNDFGEDEGDCTEKYFSEYNSQEHILILTRALDHPIFMRLDFDPSGKIVLGSGGMPVGYYTYSYRYVSDAGDRTGFSAPTPQIPVMVRDTEKCAPIYPDSMTHSKDPDISSPTTLGIHIRLRINNINNYDFIEILRVSWNAGGPETSPLREIIGKIDINDQQFSILNVLDLNGFEETLGADEGSEIMSAIERAKAIRYFNSRLYLMNVAYGSRDIDDKTEISGGVNAMYPTIQKIDKDGHGDPWKYTYYKSYMGGEHYGFGLFVWDEEGNRSFVKQIDNFTDYRFPNRRDKISTLTEDCSYKGTSRAATTELTNVQQTHEVFDLENAVSKEDKCLYHNILSKGHKYKAKLNISGCTKAQDEGLTNTAGYVKGDTLGYRPWTPTSQDEDYCASTGYRLNLTVRKGNPKPGNPYHKINYSPKGFAPDYYSMGIALDSVTSLPSWAKAFSVVRTEPAKRVVAQGIGFYDLTTAGKVYGANTGKNMNKLTFWSPDTDSIIAIEPLVVEDIINNPTNYEIQLVSPLGFFTEVYSFNNRTGHDNGIDMVCYARIISDLVGNSSLINPEENPNMGIPDPLSFPPRRYVSYAKWRSDTPQGNHFSLHPNKGNRTFEIATNGFQLAPNPSRGEHYVITTTQNIYHRATANGKVDNDNNEVEDWHEPVYIVNIIKTVIEETGIGITDTNIQTYVPTGHYQKKESIIGKGDGSDNQLFQLVDERWEDCIDELALNTETTPYDSIERFVFIKDENGDEKRWVCVTNTPSGTLTTILNDLQANGQATVGGFVVHGVYTHTEVVDETAEVFTLVFSHFNTAIDREYFLPDNETEIIVKYDDRIPIRIFGGDVGVGEGIFATHDNEYTKKGKPLNAANTFKLNLSFPYMRYELNPRIYVVNRTRGAQRIQDKDEMKFDDASESSPSRIRQLCVMSTLSSRTNLHYAFNIETPDKAVSQQYFPLINYIMRPYAWNDKKEPPADTTANHYDHNNIHAGYEIDYKDEWQLWNWGGLRFLPQVNEDYSRDDNSLGAIVSKPKVGFEEQNLFCTRIVWSDPRPPNVQDTPSVRTFPSGNLYDISDDTGEIKFAWDEISTKGNNLYAFTDRGACLLLIDKRVIHEINAEELVTVGSDIGGILNQLWISKDIGMNDEMWRSAAEYSNQLYFLNNNSAYKFASAQDTDIGRLHYHSVIYPEYIDKLGSGYTDHITGVYNILNNEYWVNFGLIGSVGGGWTGQEFSIIEHELNDSLDIAGIEYDTSVSISDGIVGIVTGDSVKITSCYGSPKIIHVGGFYQNLLPLVTEFSICNECTETIDVQQYIGGNHVTVALIAEGECYCFTLIPNTKTWQATACNPFGGNEDEPLEDYSCPTLMFGVGQEYWQGRNDHKFDRMVSYDNKIYGVRNLQTYELNKGFKIDGLPIEGVLSGICSVVQVADKEFIRIRCNSNVKPTKIEFFNNIFQYNHGDVQATLLAADLKDYHGYEQYIPRKSLTPHNRIQGRLLIFKIYHNLEEDFQVVSTDIQYKQLV